MNKELYYAVNASGKGFIYTTYPTRDEKRNIWLGTISTVYTEIVSRLSFEGFEHPNLTWKDNPIKLNLTLSVG